MTDGLRRHSERMQNRESPNKGKMFDDEKKMSQTRKGRNHSDNHSAAIYKSLIGRTCSDEHRQKLKDSWKEEKR